jgi:hypothetical protein
MVPIRGAELHFFRIFRCFLVGGAANPVLRFVNPKKASGCREVRSMSITLFFIAGAAVMLTAVYVLTTRSAAHAALAGQNTAIGLQDAAAETLADGGKQAPNRTDWQMATVAGLTDAEDLLDCLEAQGYTDRELVVLGNSSFAVRWR